MNFLRGNCKLRWILPKHDDKVQTDYNTNNMKPQCDSLILFIRTLEFFQITAKMCKTPLFISLLIGKYLKYDLHHVGSGLFISLYLYLCLFCHWAVDIDQIWNVKWLNLTLQNFINKNVMWFISISLDLCSSLACNGTYTYDTVNKSFQSEIMISSGKKHTPYQFHNQSS